MPTHHNHESRPCTQRDDGSHAAQSASAPSSAPSPSGFSDLGLPPALLQAVTELGFTSPTPVQHQTIPALLSGRDVIGVAQTGTGKTAAFGLPLLAALDAEDRTVQAIVLAPTRELAMQVADAIRSFTAHLPGIDVVAVYGGAPYHPQERALQGGAQVVVGTPGRVMDHMRRGNLHLSSVRYAVLDEADEMLRMGFAEDVEEILSHSPATRQVALFSATMPDAIRAVAKAHMDDPVQVSVTAQSTTVDSVHQTYAVVPFRHRTGALARVLATTDAEAAIVFVRTRVAAEEVGAALVARGVVAATISGDVPQKERERIVARLRDGSLHVLVATDVAARGLDVERIGLVVNFDVPREAETYVHRVGRTGRAGRSGEAITFIGGHERRTLRAIERATGQTLEEARIPTPRDVSAHRMAQALEQAEQRHARGRLDLYREQITAYLEAHELEAVDLAAVLGALLVGDGGPGTTGDEENEADEKHSSARDDEPRSPREKRAAHVESGHTQYRIGVGHKHGVRPPAIVGAITGEAGVDGKAIGKISIFPSFSLVQIRGGLSAEQLSTLATAVVSGRELRIREDTGPRRGSQGNSAEPLRRGAYRKGGQDRHHGDGDGRRRGEGRPPRGGHERRGERFSSGARRDRFEAKRRGAARRDGRPGRRP